MKPLNPASLAVILVSVFGGLDVETWATEMETAPLGMAQALVALDAWILVQPKALASLAGESFDLSACKGCMLTGVPRELAQQAADRLAAASGLRLPLLDAPPAGPVVSLTLATDPGGFPSALQVDAARFGQLAEQGYALAIQHEGVSLAARIVRGLRSGITTLVQIAADRTTLPGLIIHDWPALKYRGVQKSRNLQEGKKQRAGDAR